MAADLYPTIFCRRWVIPLFLGLNVSNLTFGICINGRNTSDERENDVCTNENNNDRGYNKEDDNFFHCWYGSKMKYSVIDLPLS